MKLGLVPTVAFSVKEGQGADGRVEGDTVVALKTADVLVDLLGRG
jgi:hypothetical protein